MDVYDFSTRASARYMGTVCDGDGKFLRSMRPSARKLGLLWEIFAFLFSDGGHDSVVHFVVKTSHLPLIWPKPD